MIIKRFNVFVNEQVTPNDINLIEDWTHDICEHITSHYGLSKNYKQLRSLIKDIVKKALSAKSFQSFNDFIGNHTIYWNNPKQLFYPKMAYLLNINDVIDKEFEDEEFNIMIISLMDSAIDNRQE